MRSLPPALAAIVFGLWGSVAQAASGPTTQTLVVEGYPYEAVLTPSQDLQSTLGAERALVAGEHYRGYLKDAPDSWVRVSRIDGVWQGLVFLNGRIEVIHDGGTAPQSRSIDRALGDTPATCGVDDAPVGVDSRSALDLPRTADLDYNTLCDRRVDGQCMLSELEVVFDSAFQQRYPDTYTDQAVSVLNMVEGYYRNALAIGFDTLTLDFPSQEYFSASTDSSQYLSDIFNTKPSLSFLKNDQSLVHVVTGRDFDGSTVGVAYVGVLCNTRYDVGTTQIVGNDMALTALTMTHELGHNFGAEHDNGTCGNGYVMSSYLDQAAYSNGFSDCSKTEMQSTIDGLTQPRACFNFPADARIAAVPDNPSAVLRGQPFTLDYDVGLQQAYLEADRLSVEGRLPAEDGHIESARLNDVDCAVDADQQGYQCTLEAPGPASTLSVTATGVSNRARLTQTVSLDQDTGDLKEVRVDDNSLTTTVTVTTLGQPDDLAARVEGTTVVLTWSDAIDNASGYAVRRRLADTTAWTVLADDLPADSTTFTDIGAAYGEDYQYQVRALPVADASAGSNLVSARVDAPPAARTDFSTEADTDTITLAWSDTDDRETALRVERQRLGTDAWTTLATLDADRTTYTDTTAVEGERYRYRLTPIGVTAEGDAIVSADVGLVSSASTDSAGTSGTGTTDSDTSGTGDRLGTSNQGGALPVWLLALGWPLARLRRRPGSA